MVSVAVEKDGDWLIVRHALTAAYGDGVVAHLVEGVGSGNGVHEIGGAVGVRGERVDEAVLLVEGSDTENISDGFWDAVGPPAVAVYVLGEAGGFTGKV